MIKKIKPWKIIGLLLISTLAFVAFLAGCSSTSSTTQPASSETITPSTSNVQPFDDTPPGDNQPPEFRNQGPGPGIRQGKGITGTIADIEKELITLSTSQGEVTINISSYTTIQKYAEGTRADLKEGLYLTVTGNESSDHTVLATSITILPDSEIPPLNPGPTKMPELNGDFAPPENMTRPDNQASNLTGTLSGIDDDTLTLMVGEEAIIITINDDTKIQKTDFVTVSDLVTGESVTVLGEQNDDGSIDATSIITGQEQMLMFDPRGNPPQPLGNEVMESS